MSQRWANDPGKRRSDVENHRRPDSVSVARRCCGDGVECRRERDRGGSEGPTRWNPLVTRAGDFGIWGHRLLLYGQRIRIVVSGRSGRGRPRRRPGPSSRSRYRDRVRPFSSFQFRSTGFYFQSLYTARSFYFVGRYDAFDDAARPGGAVRRLSAGGGWHVSERCQMRFEYLKSEPQEPDAAMMQIAFAF